MSTPILATKLFIPPPRPKAVSRPRLIERLNEALHRKLTLISAPAGFGKTTLVSEWLAASAGRERPEGPRQVAWLSLDEADSNPTRFLSYLVAALQTIAPSLGDGLTGELQSPQPPPIESVLAALLNELATIADNFVLVLDDYHVIDAQAVDHALIFLLEHLPPAMHLVITTREDPPLPLARLRARGHLVEVRATDLRFTAFEAAEFLNQIMGLKLSAQEIAALESQTEGWIAGLQLAALSMQGHEDVAGFIRSFAGDHHYIVDYLVEEVLQRQPERVRSFLLQTAILDRLSGPLCSAVTGQNDGKMLLGALERGNFFVVPLDDKRHWYRYHHLFADVLHAHLKAEQPEQVAVLHRRASAWYAENGLPADAIRHALAAAEFARAAELIELTVPATRRSREEAMLLGWLQALPDDLLRDRPVLSVHYAGTLMQSGKLAGVEARLQDAERWLEPAAASATLNEQPHPIVVDQEAFCRLPGVIAIYRAGYALATGNVADTMKYARQALVFIAEDDHMWRGAPAALLGLAYWTTGDLEAAYRSYADGMAHLQRAGHISDVIGGKIALADIRITQGRLREAMRIYEQGLQLAIEQGQPLLRGTADMFVGMSALHRERNDLTTATQHLLRSKEQGEHTGFPQNPYRWRVAMARIREAEGDLDGALELLQEAERLYVSDFYPNVRPIAALKTRIWVAQGRLAEALDWAREPALSVENDLTYLREFEHIMLARVLLACYQSDRADHSLLDAIGLLRRLLQAAEAGGRTGNVIEILVLQALAHQLQEDIPAALVPLQRALTLAEPESYVRIFIDAGLSLVVLLQEAAKHGIVPSYVRQLLTAFGKAEASPPANQVFIGTGSARAIAQQALTIEPLSERELEVLHLLGTDLNGPEIARQLMVSLNTLNTHTKNIYSKLGVNNRRAAVRRAEELDLL
jgi:LuxR family maltose regulon positive regulatory protein